MNAFWAVVTSVATIVGIVAWVRTEFTGRGTRIVYPIALASVSAVAAWQWHVISTRTKARAEATELAATWPEPSSLTFMSKGERLGIVLSGLAFLERNRDDYPETYRTATLLVHNRLDDLKRPTSPDASSAEYDYFSDAAGAMIQLLKSEARTAKR